MEKKIYLNNIFGNQIITRNSIRAFLDSLSETNEKNIILDFRDIHFISRSCADEYIKWKINFSGKEITETNMIKEVEMMFKLAQIQFRKNFGLTA